MSINKQICAMVPFYNDIDGMKRLYENLHDLGLYSVWCDGPFKGFAKINDSDKSTDGSREFIQSKPDTWLISLPEHHQYVKMTWLLQYCHPYDYSIHLGCDEYLEGDLDLLLNNLKKYDTYEPTIFRIRFVIDKKDTSERALARKNEVERIFQYPYRFHAKNTHWTYFADGSNEPYHSIDTPIDGIVLIHDNSIRSKHRDVLMNRFQQIQRFEERERYYEHQKGIGHTPSVDGLTKLFPLCKITEWSNYFMVQGKPDASKLPHRWIRFKYKDCLCVMK